MTEHEYALINGVNRSKVGRYIAAVAGGLAALLVFLFLLIVNLAGFLGWNVNLPPTILSLAVTGSIYFGLYWLFDRFAWRWRWLSRLIGVPDLSGEWSCNGQTTDADGSVTYEWVATVSIVQTWDKVRVRLKTEQSGSNSINAALIHDSVDGYRLIYNYRNDPRPGEPELRTHHGFAELTFNDDLRSAEGNYFNGHGRYTFGRMQLTRK
ncbi:hypothetical protein [Dokdonella sp.]|uniref:Cap15 family cyclic dinucleotide receptor domain-containing protein n=1 Tax=Dokdonella sp. TaxID=2291710 RepID=UPI0035298B13